MAAPDNRVPPTYRKPAFIPDGYVDVFGALSIVGKALFGDKWTGEEFAARRLAQRQAEAEEQHRREDEARQRWDQAAQWLKQRAYDRKVSSQVITKGGTFHDLPERVWAAENAWQIFDRGTAGFAEAAGYDYVTFEGHVLFRERELRSALVGRHQSSQRGQQKAATRGKNISAGEPAEEETGFDLLKRAEELRKNNRHWTKKEIAKHIAKNDKPAKRKGQGLLSPESIERAIRLPRPKRRTPRQTP